MEGKNHRIGKADGADMIRKRDSFLKKNFRNTSRKKILRALPERGGREAPGRIMWTFVYHVLVPKFEVARIGEGEVILAMAERKLFGVWCSRCV